MDDWNKFRPVRDLERAHRQRRRVRFVLVVATVLFFAVLIVRLVRPHVTEVLAYARATLTSRPKELRIPHSDLKNRFTRSHRRQRDLFPERRVRRPAELGPFDAYVLNGNRYIRVESMNKYGLLDTRTGKITWIKELPQQ